MKDIAILRAMPQHRWRWDDSTPMISFAARLPNPEVRLHESGQARSGRRKSLLAESAVYT